MSPPAPWNQGWKRRDLVRKFQRRMTGVRLTPVYVPPPKGPTAYPPGTLKVCSPADGVYACQSGMILAPSSNWPLKIPAPTTGESGLPNWKPAEKNWKFDRLPTPKPPLTKGPNSQLLA